MNLSMIPFHVRTLVTLWVALLAMPALAQDARAAEVALSLGDHQKALRLATEALEAGVRVGAELAPIYLLEAKSRAALNDAEGARRAFTCLLAVNPQFRLDRNAPHELRSPYLEARGFWSSQPAPFGAEVSLADDLSGVVVAVSDPAQLAVRVRVRLRLLGEAAFQEVVRPPDARSLLPVGQLREVRAVEYAIALLDEHGNRIFQRGSDSEPLRLDVPAPPIVQALEEPASAVAVVSPRRLPLYLAGGLTLALGAGAAVGAGVAHVKREELASDWNAGHCRGEGTTRAEVCADERSRLSRMQLAAGVLYGVGGASLITGLVLLLVAPRRQPRSTDESAALRCHDGPGELGLACRVGF
jgi:hypothetical protein